MARSSGAKLRPFAAFASLTIAALACTACTYEGPAPSVGDGDVHLTLLHTADWHSRLFPYDFTVGQVDENLGLSQENGPFGGAARMSYLLQRERARSARVLHLDSGDCFQGAPIFNYFRGEAEVRALSQTGLDVAVIGNHEFDAGGENFARQIFRWADFPIIAANYRFDPTFTLDATKPQLGRLAEPYVILNASGLRVGVIGMGNLSSLTSVFDQPNRLGIIPLHTTDVAQFYIDFLRPQVDVIVMLTHLGLGTDERMVEETSGIDIVLGGHNHIVLNPPKVAQDCARVDADGRHYVEIQGTHVSDPPTRRYCRPRNVIISHSGAFMKFLGRVDLILSDDPARVQPERPTDADARPELVYSRGLDGYEVLAHSYQLFPLDASVPEDPRIVEMLEPYEKSIRNLIDLDLLVGYAPTAVRRFGSQGGDSPLGNLIASSMLLRLGVQTDFALTNTTGIRADLVPGAVSAEQIFNVFPFDNSVSKMFVSGREVRELFDFVARRSTQRGCAAQAQVAGARVVIECGGCERTGGAPCASRIAIGTSATTCTRDEDCGEGLCDKRPETDPSTWRCLLPLTDDASYELATNNYIAQGGSGFRVLQRNTTQVDTLVQQRDVLIDFLRQGAPCGADRSTGELPVCTSDADCTSGYVCGCAARSRFDEASRMCVGPGMTTSCAEGAGRCILAACATDVATFHAQRACRDSIDPVVRARCECDAQADAQEECKFLACIDENLGAVTDGRVRMRSF